MKKFLRYTVLAASVTAMTGCTVTEATYSPAYDNDYVYSVGYTDYQPYWGGGYYSGYGWGGGRWGGGHWGGGHWGGGHWGGGHWGGGHWGGGHGRR